MIEEILLEYLSGALSVPVQMERTKNDPASFVLLEKTGSGEDGPGVLAATIAAQSYAPTKLAAARLNEQVKAALLDADSLPEIVSCALNSDYDYTDTTDKRYRYQAVFYFVHY